MRKLAIAFTLLFSLSLPSCFAGPHQLRRTVDDWDQKLYVQSPWLNAALWVIPVFPLATWGALIGDFFVTDGYTFWIKDAFSGEEGTGFKHYDTGAAKNMKSLLMPDGKFLEISGS